MRDDYSDLVTRLATGVDVANPQRLATMEPTPQQAAERWVAARGWKRGAHPTPTAPQLLALVLRWCAAQGWGVEPTVRHLGPAIRRAGFRRGQHRRVPTYWVDEDSSRALWLACGVRPPPKPRSRYVPKPRVPPPLVRAVLEAHPNSRPLVDSTLAVYPSAAWAGKLVRCPPSTISHGAHRGCTAAGRLWRLLTPEEVGALPHTLRTGERWTSIRW